MRLFRCFVAHEFLVQMRSVRFRGLVVIYVLAASLAPALAFFVSRRGTRMVGPSLYETVLFALQPSLTALFAVGLSIDAIARERDEGSFPVLSVAPLSSAGYLLRRWVALLVVCIPVSLLPTLIAAAFAARQDSALPVVLMFAEGWLVYILPPLLLASALSIALGTITGRTVLAALFGVALFTVGIGTINGFVLHRHLHFDGPAILLGARGQTIERLLWALRGYWFLRTPTDAAFPLRSELRALSARAGITAAMGVVFLTLAAFYLRRTRRDLRPWHIPEKHQLRTLLRTINRVREEYAPDAGASTADRVLMVAGLALAALLVANSVGQQKAFAALARERFAAERTAAVPTSTSVLLDSVHIDASVTLGGFLHSRAVTAVRNGGSRPEAHLSFMLNPLLSLRAATVDRGGVHVRRAWERLDVDLDPPLAPGESRSLTFAIEGRPADIDFNLTQPGTFAQRWKRYVEASEPLYVPDLSQSAVTPAASEVRMHLRGSDLAPVLRYTPWKLQPPEEGDGFIAEAIVPSSSIDIRLRHPYAFATDDCGTASAPGEMVSHCTDGLGGYAVFGGPLQRRAIAPDVELAYIPAHQRVVIAQSAAFASAAGRAVEAWAGLALPRHILFIEQPTEPNAEPSFNYWMTDVQQLGSRATVFLFPEDVFHSGRPIDSSSFAASIVAGTLRGRRVVVAEQAGFFRRLFTALAFSRLGLRNGRNIEPGTGPPPETAPLLDAHWRPTSRMSKVLGALEYRVGVDHVVEGVNDFLSRPGAGTAKELLDCIGRRGGVDLSQTYADYFAGSALPELTLDGVTFQQRGEGWTVNGVVRNKATGEAFVPVALRTARGTLWQSVRVGSGGSAPFEISSPSEPHAVQLDPDGVCYRRAAVGLVESVEYRGGAR
jgi:ABC-type transport system involved in multi-copper enzyme maturation permease subunit